MICNDPIRDKADSLLFNKHHIKTRGFAVAFSPTLPPLLHQTHLFVVRHITEPAVDPNTTKHTILEAIITATTFRMQMIGISIRVTQAGLTIMAASTLYFPELFFSCSSHEYLLFIFKQENIDVIGENACFIAAKMRNSVR